MPISPAFVQTGHPYAWGETSPLFPLSTVERGKAKVKSWTWVTVNYQDTGNMFIGLGAKRRPKAEAQHPN